MDDQYLLSDLNNSDNRQYLIVGAAAILLVVAGIAAYFLLVDTPTLREEIDNADEGVSVKEGEFRIRDGEFVETGLILGYHKGELFEWVRQENGSQLMRITADLDPENGIPEAYITGYITKQDGENVFTADIYIDEEFRQEVTPINLVWGMNYTNFRPYRFDEEIRPGVYKDSITDTDVRRFKSEGPYSDAEVNVAVGSLTQDTIPSGELGNITVIAAR